MVRLGSEKRPVFLRVQTEARLREVVERCVEVGAHYVARPSPTSLRTLAISNACSTHRPLRIAIVEWVATNRAHVVAARNSRNAVRCSMKLGAKRWAWGIPLLVPRNS